MSSAQASSSTQITQPSQAVTHAQSYIVDDFFGASPSRHDRRISFAATPEESSAAGALPPYVEHDSELPTYSLTAPEPVTLAMFLFKFGFLFPPFWLLGVFILLSPLSPPPAREGPAAWLPEKTEAERQEILDRMRRVEVKWAKRCLFALLALLLVVLITGLAIWMVMKS